MIASMLDNSYIADIIMWAARTDYAHHVDIAGMILAQAVKFIP